jgi:hypothetical protein
LPADQTNQKKAAAQQAANGQIMGAVLHDLHRRSALLATAARASWTPFLALLTLPPHQLLYCRYAETARNYFQNTGKRVKAWCFVQGARANRIFYAFEVREALLSQPIRQGPFNPRQPFEQLNCQRLNVVQQCED